MVHDEQELDQITGKLLKQTGNDEPSELFTERVMRSVLATQAPTVKPYSFYYYWLLLTIPVLIAGGLYLSAPTILMNKFLKFLEPIDLFIHSVVSFIMDFIQRLLSISFSPMVIIGSLAALSLLVVESLITKKNHQL